KAETNLVSAGSTAWLYSLRYEPQLNSVESVSTRHARVRARFSLGAWIHWKGYGQSNQPDSSGLSLVDGASERQWRSQIHRISGEGFRRERGQPGARPWRQADARLRENRRFHADVRRSLSGVRLTADRGGTLAAGDAPLRAGRRRRFREGRRGRLHGNVS